MNTPSYLPPYALNMCVFLSFLTQIEFAFFWNKELHIPRTVHKDGECHISETLPRMPRSLILGWFSWDLTVPASIPATDFLCLQAWMLSFHLQSHCPIWICFSKHFEQHYSFEPFRHGLWDSVDQVGDDRCNWFVENFRSSEEDLLGKVACLLPL